ncbi:MAG: hypothetical protein CW716_12745 [Candidatus Bathyarchaeum sp.]|nr:MAG: hypothetical protein CW716_12745 [Candidatus Bathyarchaeum sp.]
MPANSIDTFFACSLIVVVVVVSMAATTRVAMPYITGLQDINEEDYMLKIAEHVIVNPGSPEDWGKNVSVTPEVFGLAKDNSFSYELDADKVSRLNSQNAYALSYFEMMQTLRLEKVALRFVFSQVLDIDVTLDSNTTVDDSTLYSFNVAVSRNQAPVATDLHCYIVANNFSNDTASSTSTNGQGIVEIAIPNSSNGTALLIVFARAPYDQRITAQTVYAFGHLSSEPAPNNTFLNLSPLNSTLEVDSNVSDISLEAAYAFSYGYKSGLTSTSNETYTIPDFLDSSPQVLVVVGWSSSDFFVEWTSYPQIPLEVGANFEDAECFSFNYIVTIDGVFYRLNVQCGGPSL